MPKRISTVGEHWRDTQVAQHEQEARERLEAQRAQRERHLNTASGFPQELVVYADEIPMPTRDAPSPHEDTQSSPAPQGEVTPLDTAPLGSPILLDLLKGHTVDAIAKARALPRDEVDTFAQRQDVLEIYTSIRSAITQDILAGALGPVAMARATANEMIDRLLQLSRQTSTPPAVQHRSAIDLLSIAGYGPTRRVQNVSTDALISQMNPEEIKRYADTGEWPARFKDLLVQPHLITASLPTPDPMPTHTPSPTAHHPVDLTPGDEGAFLYENDVDHEN